MNQFEKHPRCKKFKANCKNYENLMGSKQIYLIIFYKQAKLRSHMVKHLFDTYQWDECWGNYLNSLRNSMIGAVNRLKDIGCPYYRSNFDNPPCQGCRLFDRCSQTLSIWEDHYFGLVDQAIKDGFEHPLYMYYISGSELKTIVVFHPTSKVIIKCIEFNSAYNVATAYCYLTGFLTEKSRVERDVLKGESILYCTYETWERIIPKAPQAKVKISEPKKKRKPYKRPSKQEWRKYLDEYQEERGNDWE